MAESVSGTCHCGACRVTLDLSRPAGELRLRACQCGFCKPRGAKTISDPEGRARLRTESSDTVLRYRFGLRLADYLLCAKCGTYLAAVQPDEDEAIAVVNVGGLGMAPFEGRDPEPVSYDNEVIIDRLTRRRSYWMPITLDLTASRRQPSAAVEHLPG